MKEERGVRSGREGKEGREGRARGRGREVCEETASHLSRHQTYHLSSLWVPVSKGWSPDLVPHLARYHHKDPNLKGEGG